MQLLDTLKSLIEASKDVIANWEKGNLAGAVTNLGCEIEDAETAIAGLVNPVGEDHPYYTREDWREEVRLNDTKLGYKEWVQHNLDANYGSGQIAIAEAGNHPCEGCKDCNSDGDRCINEIECVAWDIYTRRCTDPAYCPDNCPKHQTFCPLEVSRPENNAMIKKEALNARK